MIVRATEKETELQRATVSERSRERATNRQSRHKQTERETEQTLRQNLMTVLAASGGSLSVDAAGEWGGQAVG